VLWAKPFWQALLLGLLLLLVQNAATSEKKILVTM
jgi:hypothetical protein